jgi:hypothetical protein
MHMAMIGHSAAGLYLNKVDGVIGSMNKFREKAGRYFFGCNILKVVKDAGIHILIIYIY